jgi:hypothetical protein
LLVEAAAELSDRLEDRHRAGVLGSGPVVGQHAGVLEGGELADQPHVVVLFGRADAIPETLLDLVAADRGDQLVAAHADVPVDPPDRRGDVVVAEGVTWWSRNARYHEIAWW